MTGQRFMQECLRLAMLGKGRVSPNPMVGAVLVKNGRIIARGHHSSFGGAHAEVDCLRHAEGDLTGAILYVNLEPCSYHGKTPPCTDLIISRGVSDVVTAMRDPNPRVAGRGLQKLKHAGVSVREGLLEEEAQELNRVFARHITTHRPYVHMKIAQSRDGRISGAPTRWISSLASRKRVHALRGEYDAVLVGAGTVRTDDPDLTVRLVRGRNPDVVILDGGFSLPRERKLFKPDSSRRVFLFTTTRALAGNPAKARSLASRGVTVETLKGIGGKLALRQVLDRLYRSNIASVLVEGGSTVFTQFVAEGIIDEATLFVAPDIFGKGLPGIKLADTSGRMRSEPERVHVARSGRDTMINVLFRQIKS